MCGWSEAGHQGVDGFAQGFFDHPSERIPAALFGIQVF